MALGLVACLASAGAQALTDPGFEGAYQPVASQSDLPSQKAQISGEIAPGWEDNSNWADVGIVYSRDTNNPHRGRASQKIAISRVNTGAVQFVQTVAFTKGRVNEFPRLVARHARARASRFCFVNQERHTRSMETRSRVFRRSGRSSGSQASFRKTHPVS